MNSVLVGVQQLQTNQSASSYHEAISLSDNFGQPTNMISMGTVPVSRKILPIQRDPLIEQYFRYDAKQRLEFRRKTALRIKSFESIFLVLDWSLRGDVDDAYDSAVDLLAECEGVLIGALQYLYLEYSAKGVNQLELETKLDVLINGLARAQRLSAESRLKAVGSLMASKSRIVKVAIIDAFVLLENKRNKKRIRGFLSWFASKETDAYIRQYAEDALEDLT
jgi:hypothetical protein